MSKEKLVFVGAYASCDNSKSLIISSGFLVVENGKIVKKGTTTEFNELNKEDYWKTYKVKILTKGQFLMPGFVDCHTHGPQFPNLGIGLDRPLLEWLDKYTFPLEKLYSKEEFAGQIYNQVVRKLLKNGTTTACYFGSLHLNGTLQLVNNVVQHGQRALIGKVSMNVENSMGYYNDTEKEVADAEEFLKKVIGLENPLVQPVVTPRFAVSCNKELLDKLGELANKYNLRIQSHISENLGEIECVLENNPEMKTYAEVYDASKLLTKKCIMAHAVHLRPEEMALLSRRGVSIAHCPASNTRLQSGLCPLRTLLDYGITVGLGTDVSGGDSASILDAIRRAMDVSVHLKLTGALGNTIISWKEAFYLATLGGAKALNLEDKVGSFDIGKELDALLIDVYKSDGPIDQQDYSVADNEQEYIEHLLQRFIYLGDDRNIIKVYVQGKEIMI